MSAALDWTIWLLLVVTQILVASSAAASRYRRTWFAAYLYFAAAKSLVLLLIAVWTRDQRLYSECSTIAALLALVPIAGAISEVWKQVFGPAISLPRGTLARFISTAVVIGSLAPVFAGLFRAHTPQEFINAILNTEVATLSAAMVTLVALVIYSKYLGAYWHPSQAEIVGGFCLWMGVNWLLFFLASQQLMKILEAQRIGQAFYLVALCWWYRVTRKEHEPTTVTSEEVEAALLNLELEMKD